MKTPKPNRRIGLEIYNDISAQLYLAKRYSHKFVSDCLKLAVDVIPAEEVPNRFSHGKYKKYSNKKKKFASH